MAKKQSAPTDFEFGVTIFKGLVTGEDTLGGGAGRDAIISNDVTTEVPPLQGGPAVPMFINARGNGKGSIEGAGISAFLVTMNEFAAGAIAGSLKQGKSPFTVHYNLKQQFWITDCQVIVRVDLDKTFDQFSAALSAGGFLGIDSVSLNFAYQSCITSGAITTDIKMNNATLAPDPHLYYWRPENVLTITKKFYKCDMGDIFR